MFFRSVEFSFKSHRNSTRTYVGQPPTPMCMSRKAWQVSVSECCAVAWQAWLRLGLTWPRRSRPESLGSERCGATLTTPSPGRAFTADFGHPGSNPRQLRLAVVKLPSCFTEAQSLCLLPRAQAAILGMEPEGAQAVLFHGAGEGNSSLKIAQSSKAT